MDKSWKVLQELYGKLYSVISEKLEDEFYYDDRRGVDVGKYTDQVLADFIGGLLEDEVIKNRLARQIKKLAVEDIKKRQKAYREADRRNRELWKVTKGKIPCICDCGYVHEKTKKEVMEGSNTFVCKECMAKNEGKWINEIVGDRRIYEVFGIK